MMLQERLENLPMVCDIGVRRNAKGHRESWTGYKLHLDAIDGGIPVSCLLTSSSVLDSQAAIPLATLIACNPAFRSQHFYSRVFFVVAGARAVHHFCHQNVMPDSEFCRRLIR